MGFTIGPPSDEALAFRAEQDQIDQANGSYTLDRLHENRMAINAMRAQNNGMVPQDMNVPSVRGNTQINYQKSAFIPKQLPHTQSGSIDGNAIVAQMRASKAALAEQNPDGYGAATIYNSRRF